MALAIFDLDKTLIAGDSDFLWGEYLAEIGVVDSQTYQKQNQYFFDQYNQGQLDVDAYLRFCLAPLRHQPLEKLKQWHQAFFQKKIKAILLKTAQKAINKHREQGDTLLVITATNRFVASPIIRYYGIENILATEPEFDGNFYTGNVSGTPCFRQGKVVNLKQWLSKKNENLNGAFFYSDSHNDLPLLSLVDNPMVVNGDDKLKKIAQEKGWPCLEWY